MLFDCKKEVNSINDLLNIEEKIIKSFKKQEIDPYTRNVLFFRGQSDYSWGLEPGIKRVDGLVEWKELQGYNANDYTLFEYIAKCQHYGKKTRFLDYSTDIDIALYFACNENENKDGSLYICPYVPRKSHWCDTIIISELSLLKNEIPVSDFSVQLFEKYSNFKDKYDGIADLSKCIVSWLNHGFMVLPDKNEYEVIKEYNPRICRQKGAFFICGNQTKKELDSWSRLSTHAGYNIIIPKICDIPDTIQKEERVIKIRISSFMKKDIMEYLNGKGINKEYLLGE